MLPYKLFIRAGSIADFGRPRFQILAKSLVWEQLQSLADRTEDYSPLN